ncbi:dihydroneopterin aldolase [Niveispirillum sp.]|uniref:dihydroneopterin aldolase n=1 Tax=Niveispirillum sp. TaxID=1917217 RepID=UPI001B3DAD02|nr:dihydroneopterin aldolase [Niveispirillum sp.]MBP7337105.1 dihydroneopterin aldolase [Niveispirillum sp.]
MSDHILVHRIAVYAHHGLTAEEAKLGQRFFISLDCTLDLSAAGEADDWDLSVCYAKLTAATTRIATARRFRTIEGVAEAVAADLLDGFPTIQVVMVQVDKPSAPVPAIIDGVSVRITRSRKR